VSGRRYEAEVLPGLAPFAHAELAALPGARPDPLPGDPAAAARLDRLPFAWSGGGDPPLDPLRTVTSVQRVLDFAVPRPRALLGDQALRAIVREARAVAAAAGPFAGLRLEAAGRDSAVFGRLRAALARELGLADAPDDGELRLRVRPRPGEGPPGWQVLIRTTPRPASARAWRVANLPGGLNACVAAAIWRWVGVDPGQRVLNPMCGSGTLLIERARMGPAARLAGLDLDPDALAAAAANAEAAGLTVDSDLAGRGGPAGRATVELRLADAGATPFEAGSFDALVADPPWGDAVGDAGELPVAYRRLLEESARLVAPGGTAVLVTHALRAFDAALEGARDAWREDGRLRVFHGGHRPALVRLVRRGKRPTDAPGRGVSAC
jgi:SAM-dependent methyltransferase